MRQRTPPTRASILFAVAACAALLPACRGGTDGRVWTTQERDLYKGIPSRIEFSLPAGRAGDPGRIAADAWERFERIGPVFDAFDARSEVGRLNAAWKDGPVEVSADLARVVSLSREAAASTDGAFDPTIWPLKRLWREASRTGVEPSPEGVADAVRRIGLGRVTAPDDRHLRFGSPDAQLDFGGIVKGFAVDRVAQLLRAAGATDGLVQCGGEIAAWGESPRGGPWRIAVRDPRRAGVAWGTISAPGGVRVSTSGNYEQPVMVGGREFHHVLDPRSGRPVDTETLGVTVAVPDGVDASARADALATALTVMGPRRGSEVVEALPGIAALFLVRDGDGVREVATSRMAGLYSPGVAGAWERERASRR
jgi:thiamine biosynthesis lipoprotein